MVIESFSSSRIQGSQNNTFVPNVHISPFFNISRDWLLYFEVGNPQDKKTKTADQEKGGKGIEKY